MNIEKLKLKAEQGDADAQFQLANKFFYGEGVKVDYAQSLKWATRSAAQDNPKARYRLATLYNNFRYGIPKNEEKAKVLFEGAKEGLIRLAGQNDAQAQYNLGCMYDHGKGVERNEQEAAKWLRKAAEQEHAAAQYYLGWMYFNGKGVENDEQEVAKWLRKAAEQEHAPAQCLLGWMYSNGEGVEKNEQEAVKWYRKAAEQEHAQAMVKLSLLAWFANNSIEAYMWSDLAAFYGGTWEGLEMGQNELNPDQIAEAEAKAREFHQKIEARKQV